jgi:tetratricopeptide (TPR) repeat protein
MNLENQTSDLANCPQKLEIPFFEKIVAYCRDIENNANSPEFYLDLGQTFYRLGTELNPENFYSYQEIWEILAKQANTNDSLTELYELNDALFLSVTSHLSDEDFVEELYRTYLKRMADVGGKDNFLYHLSHGSLTRAECTAQMRKSLEFVSRLISPSASICFHEAIAAYRRAVELNPDSDESYHCLGEALASQGKLDEAILAYRRATELNPSLDKSYYNLGKILAKQNHFDEAIFAYRYAIELNPNLGEVYLKLGEVLAKNGNLEEALAVYRQALELNQNYQGFFRNLVEIFVQQGNLEEALAVYQQAVQIQLNNQDNSTQFSVKYYCKLAILLAEKGLLDEAVACFQQAPQIQPSTGFIYENIWKGLNQLAPLDEERFYYPTEINPTEVYQYFSQTCQYTVMGMDSLTEANKVFLSESGLSLANLEIIRQDSLALEEIYINSFGGSPKVNLSREALKNPRKKGVWLDVRHGRYFQNSIVETGYIYLLCPMTGKILRSNHSFSLHCPHRTGGGVWHPIHIYRFVSRETFYLTVNSWLGNKSFLYFPNRELIIKLTEERYVAQEQVINMFKVDAVSYWPQVKSYLSQEKQKKEVAVDLGFFLNLGHYLWNDLTGIQKLSDNLTLEKVDKFLIGPNEFFKFGEVFPEIPAEKIVKVTDSWSLFKTIVDNNYLAVWTTDLVVNENLAQRIYQAAVKKCSPEFLQQVETSKKHFPLICFQIRTHCRVWLSQVEGIANIINNLYKDFPYIGVVFEGWSRPETEEPSGQNQEQTYYFEYMIENNNALVEQIIALLDPQISTYNAIGRMMYEIIAWDRALDMFIAPGGSGACLISWIANKPGVFHGNTKACSAGAEEYWNISRENLVPPVFLSPSYVTDVPNSERTQNDLNYDCDWKPIYSEALKIVNQLIQARESQ